MESLLQSKISIDLEDNVQAVCRRKAPECKRSRFDSSLFILTRKFVDFVRTAPRGIVDLNNISTKLGIPKRRLYDITNILSGIGLIGKKSKNHVRWIGSNIPNFEALPQQKKLQEGLDDLSAMEDALDELIKDCAQQLFELTDDKENEGLAYVTYRDIQSIQAFHEQIVIAVKAPAETTLDIPAPREDSISVGIRSTRGPIDVYLFEVKQGNSTNEMSEGVETSLSKSKHSENPDKEESPPHQSE